MEFKDYYAALGVDKTAGPDEIKKAYRKLARKYHPDVSKESDADARMKEVNEAYAVLGDAEKRAAYDELGRLPRGAGGFGAAPGREGGFGDGGFGDGLDDPSDFFSQLFGQAARARQAGAKGGRRMRGRDQHAAIEITLADAYRGATRPLNLRTAQYDAQGQLAGSERIVNVQVPKGVMEGQHLRLAGMGGPGLGDAGPGDLYLEVHFGADRRYRVDGRDVYAKTPVAPWEAALGGEIEVATPDGKVQLKVPAGSQAGRKLRLRGRGIPAAAPGEAAGDLYLVLEVVVPAPQTDEQRKLYQNLAREMAFDARAGTGG